MNVEIGHTLSKDKEKMKNETEDGREKCTVQIFVNRTLLIEKNVALNL